MKRDLLPLTLIVLLLAGLGGFAWLTHNPEAEIVERAQEWPLVGPLARAFRERYPPPTPAPSEIEGEPAGGAEPMSAESAERPRRERPSGILGEVWVLEGTDLKTEPSPEAETLETLTAIANVAYLERRGDWFHVWRYDFEGWVHLEDHDEARPPLGEDPEPPRPLEPREPDAEKLAAAREILGEAEREMRLGPYRLYTDTRDDDLLAFLHPLAASLDQVYFRRYGRVPLGTPREAVVLFDGRGGYRLLQLRSEKIAGLEASGHNSHGVAAFYAGGRPHSEVASTLIHELAHLVNRRALGPALPPWLDEGIADDLALSKIEGGKLLPPLLGGHRLARDGRVVWTGGMGSLLRVQEVARGEKLPRLRQLMGLDWEGFVGSPRSRLYYSESALWVRFLLQGEGGRHAEAFRAYLDAVAAGEPVEPEALRSRLERTWEALDLAFVQWLLAQRVS